MSDYLMRDDAPLSDEEWERLDHVVNSTARSFLVGRRFLDVKGPYGAGVEFVPIGHGDSRRVINLEVIEEDFTLFWREIQSSHDTPFELQLGQAARAAMAAARLEDAMILGELMTVAEKNVTLGDWSTGDTPLTDIVRATEMLFDDGYVGPYAVVLSPDLYINTQRVSEGMARLLAELITDVATGGLFRSPLLETGRGFVLSLGAYNFDLVVGQDLITSYQGNEGLNHLFGVVESIALRVKRPGAIITLGG